MERNRTRDERTNSTGTITYTYPDDPGERKASSTSTVKVGQYQSMFDVVTPRFKRRRNRGDIINNPMSSVRTTEDISNVPWYNYLGSQYDSQGKRIAKSGFVDQGQMLGTSVCSGYLAPPSIDVDRLVSLASTKAWAGVDASKASSLVTIAEARKTASSVSSVLRRAFSIARAIRRLDAAYLRKEISLRELKDRYLEYRYAIRPLAYDMKSIVDAWNEVRDSKPRFVSRGQEEDSDSVSGNYSDSGAFSSCLCPGSRSSHRTVKVRAGVLYTVDASDLSRLQTWGGLNFASAAWELLPFSFIFDWFLNIGRTIASWEPKLFCTVLCSWHTIEITDVQQSSVPSVLVKPGVYPDQVKRGRNVSGSGSMSKVTVSKSRIPEAPRSILPQIDINLDFLKILDLVLILEKILKK